MRAKVINEASEHFGSVIDVRSIDYRYVTGYKDGRERIRVGFDEVKLECDSEWEKDVVKYRELLKIKSQVPSMKFYAALCYAIEQHFDFEIKNIQVVNDINEKVRKNYWYKNIECLINVTRPVNIRVLGRDYSGLYDISIEDIEYEEFAKGCSEGIHRLRRLIDESNEKLAVYEKALKGMTNLHEMLEHQKSIGGS